MNTGPNPLLTRLTRQGKGPSLRLTLWLAFGLGFITLAITTWETYQMRDTSPGLLTTILLVAGWAITILSPPITAIMVECKAKPCPLNLCCSWSELIPFPLSSI